MTAIRVLLVCSLSSLFVLAAPAARADSDGVPSISGSWSGKITSKYWDQTSTGAVHPKQKYKSKVAVTIDQAGAAIEMTLNFNQAFPVDTSSSLPSLVLTGFVGNYHVSAAEDSTAALPAVAWSGTTNKKGTKLTLTGVAASTEFTQEIVVKLKKTGP